jgi:hypothetical protein
MKKTLSIIIAVAMIFGAAMTASAAIGVQVTLTSPTITKAVGACEKAGAVTFSFPAGAVLNAGDWWYMDLPENATLCKDVDYLIIGNNNAFAADHYVGVDTTLPTWVDFLDVTDTLVTTAGGAVGTTVGPMVAVAAGAAPGGVTVAGANMAIRVVGVSGSRRVTLYVASDAPPAGAITVGVDTALNVKILDGAQHNAVPAVAGDTRIVTDLNKTAFSTTDATTVLSTGKYRMYGQHTADTLPAAAASKAKNNEFVGVLGGVVPFVENTLCVSAATAVGNLHVSFASKNDEFTFTGDSQIAHTGTANTISLKSCVPAKSSVNDQIKIGEQDACFFNYETAGVAGGYCAAHVASNIYLQSDPAFGTLDDLYDIVWESKTSGVYFSGLPTIKGLTAAETVCKDAGTAVGLGTTDFCAGSTCSVAGGDVAFEAATPCTIAAKNQINKVFTYGGSIATIHTYKYLVFDFARFVYDKSVVKAGTQVDIQVTLQKYPCGQIFTGTIAIGTFVTECTTTSTTSDTLLFPYLIGSKYAGWFSAFVITNGSTAAGTATLTAVDENGNTATYTTPSIGSLRHFNSSVLTAADWTQSASNTANFDMSASYVLKVLCNFDLGAGIAYMGNLNEGSAIAYSAESDDWR